MIDLKIQTSSKRDIPLYNCQIALPKAYESAPYQHAQDPDTVVVHPKAIMRPAPTVRGDADTYRLPLEGVETRGGASFQVGGNDDNEEEDDGEVEVVWKEADGVISGERICIMLPSRRT